MTSHRTRFFHALCGIGYADKMAIGQLNRFVHILFKSGFFNMFTFSRFFWSSVYIYIMGGTVAISWVIRRTGTRVTSGYRPRQTTPSLS